MGDKKNKTSVHVLLVSSLSGVARGLAGFPIEQPIEAVKTQWQARPAHRNEFKIAQSIYYQKGVLKGFYAGSIPNLSRILFKNVYRYPLMIGLPGLYKDILPAKIKNNQKI
jgi:hypothetical protein